MRVCTRSRNGIFALVLLIPFTAAAQPAKTAEVVGSAKIGAVTRQIVMRFSCALDHGKINNLGVEMDIPDAEMLKISFDVIPFEGPGALNGKMHLTATAAAAGGGGGGGGAQAITAKHAATAAQVDLSTSGSFGNNGTPGTTFTFGWAVTPGSKSQLKNLQALASTLSHGASRWSWRIENPAGGRPPIEAIADLTQDDASRLQAAVAGCE